MTSTNHERITFKDIAKGDRLRVRYTDGGREISANMAYPASASVSVTRTIVAEVEHLALGKAWLDSNGHTVVHHSWDDLSIVRLSGDKQEFVLRSGDVWTDSDLKAVQEWDVPAAIVAKRLGRTYNAVMTRRSILRRKFNRQLLNERLAPASKQ